MNETARRKERIDRPIKVLSDDVYALSSLRNLAYLAGPKVLPALALILLTALAPNPYTQRVIVIATIFALLAVSWDFLASTTGLISLGHALFFGAGAYFTAILNTVVGLPSPVALLLAAVGGGVVCTALLVPCLPLRGIYFSMTTLVYPMLATRVIEATGILGGTDGFVGIDPLSGRLLESLGVVGLLLVLVFSLSRLLATDFGIMLRAIGDDHQAAAAAGIDVTRHRVISVFIAATIGSLAGAYFTHVYMFAGMSSLALELSILPIAAAVIGGRGTIGGAALGALILVPLSEAARDFGSLRIVLYSTLLVVMIVWKPEGIMSYLQRRYHQVERWVDV